MLFSQFLLKWLSLKAARFLHNSMLRQLLRCVRVPSPSVHLELLDRCSQWLMLELHRSALHYTHC